MGKICLKGIFERYCKTLHSVDDNSLYIPDALIHLGLPLAFFIFAIIKAEHVIQLRAFFPNAITAISVISGFMCGLAVMIFELRISLDQSRGELGESAQEIELIDELFSDVLWCVVVGFLTVGFMAFSGGESDTSLANSLFTALALGLCVNFVIVAFMCIKRIDACYQFVSRFWGHKK